MRLHDALIQSAARTPGAPAVQGPAGCFTCGELDRLANDIARALLARGAGAGDRVGLWLDKSAVAVAGMQAVLRLGAAYVPIDPRNPPVRTAAILKDCEATALLTTPERASALTDLASPLSCLLVGPASRAGPSAGAARLAAPTEGPLPEVNVGPSDLAYILYTSGSTGRPRGVCIRHGNALAFVRWAVEELGVTAADRLANHAPFHFDLSVFDLYAAFSAAASVVLIPDELSYSPARLVDLLRREQITLWYSVPSALLLMMEHGGLLDRDPGPLRAILFAGEVFPIKPLRRLRERWPSVRLLNLYGPTETNVCTFHEVRELSPDQVSPVPIGRACCGNTVWARKEDGSTAGLGEEGELLVCGPTVMQGYCGQEPQGDRPYATGDIVRVLEDGCFQFVGRRDRMVKVRGRRIDPGEIESVLQDHPDIAAAAVVVSGSGLSARLTAFLVPAAVGAASRAAPEKGPARLAGPTPATPSLLDIKTHCAQRLPPYMIVDTVRYLPELPLGRTGKVDHQKLERLLTGEVE